MVMAVQCRTGGRRGNARGACWPRVRGNYQACVGQVQRAHHRCGDACSETRCRGQQSMYPDQGREARRRQRWRLLNNRGCGGVKLNPARSPLDARCVLNNLHTSRGAQCIPHGQGPEGTASQADGGAWGRAHVPYQVTHLIEQLANSFCHPLSVNSSVDTSLFLRGREQAGRGMQVTLRPGALRHRPSEVACQHILTRTPGHHPNGRSKTRDALTYQPSLQFRCCRALKA